MAFVNFGWRQMTVSCLVLASAGPAAAQPSVPIEVRFTLVDANDRPIAGVPLRLVPATETAWQQPRAGTQATTNAAGEVRWSTQGAIQTRQRKMPTNFFTQAISAAQETKHLTIGAELTYLGRPWLVVGEADHFADGTTAQLDGMRVYGPDANGAFTVQATLKSGNWNLPGVPSPLPTPGHQVTRFAMTPAGFGWTVELVIKRSLEPVLR